MAVRRRLSRTRAAIGAALLYYITKLVRDENKALDVLQEVWLKALRTIGD